MLGLNTEFNVPCHLQSTVMELKSALTQCFSCCWQRRSQRTTIMQSDSSDERKHHTSITRYISSCCSVDHKFSWVFFLVLSFFQLWCVFTESGEASCGVSSGIRQEKKKETFKSTPPCHAYGGGKGGRSTALHHVLRYALHVTPLNRRCNSQRDRVIVFCHCLWCLYTAGEISVVKLLLIFSSWFKHFSSMTLG